MLRYVIRRLIWVVFLLFAVSIVTFVLFFLMPGDPASASVPRQATPEVIEQVRERMGLNQPIWMQYRDSCTARTASASGGRAASSTGRPTSATRSRTRSRCSTSSSTGCR